MTIQEAFDELSRVHSDLARDHQDLLIRFTVLCGLLDSRGIISKGELDRETAHIIAISDQRIAELNSEEPGGT